MGVWRKSKEVSRLREEAVQGPQAAVCLAGVGRRQEALVVELSEWGQRGDAGKG